MYRPVASNWLILAFLCTNTYRERERERETDRHPYNQTEFNDAIHAMHAIICKPKAKAKCQMPNAKCQSQARKQGQCRWMDGCLCGRTSATLTAFADVATSSGEKPSGSGLLTRALLCLRTSPTSATFPTVHAWDSCSSRD